VFGLGHVGAPLASVWLRSGVRVIGIDKSSKVIENTKKGITHIPEPLVNESFSMGLQENRFFIYEDPVKASFDSKLKMICVPVLIKNNKPDL
jgi:UDP-N-acetyl-D-mannosaminuronate dehydrogenase